MLLPREEVLLVMDEFTSSLDRTIANTTCAALARLLRLGGGDSERRGPRLIEAVFHA